MTYDLTRRCAVFLTIVSGMHKGTAGSNADGAESRFLDAANYELDWISRRTFIR